MARNVHSGLRARRRSLALRAAAITISAATIVAGLSAPAAATPAQMRPAPANTVRYAVIKAACPVPANPEANRCMALQRVNVAKGTDGARAYLTPSYSVGPAGGYTPADLAKAYGVNAQSSVGSTQKIAIVDWDDDPHARADLNDFDVHYGLAQETSASFAVVNQDGVAAPLPGPTSDAVETTLDIETARAVCNRCKILLVESNSALGQDLAAAVDTAARLGATEISNSYGAPEDPANPDPASTVAAYNHPGVVITASTGDDGWYDWDDINQLGGASSDAPNTSASYPTVVSVAGTKLTLNADGTRHAETVWNENGPEDDGTYTGASGGGCSTMYAAPSFQRSAAGFTATGCGTRKLVGDVAALADPFTGFDVYDSGNGGWLTIGGTSLSSPIVAAIWALAGGAEHVSYPAQSLYSSYHTVPSSLYDVTAGGNSFCGGDTTAHCAAVLDGETGTGNPNNLASAQGEYLGLLDCSFAHDGSEPGPSTPRDPECNARTGYDGASGVGTPKGVRAFQPAPPRVTIAHPALMKLKTAEKFKVTSFTDPVPGAAGYSWSFGDGTARTSSATHTYRKAGTFTVSLRATDRAGRTASATTRITVGRALALKMTTRTSVRRNTTYRWTSSGSSDPNTGGKFARYVWTWGDGHSSTGHSSVTHRYAKSGRYTVTLTITDNAGVRTSKRESVRVVG